jgi:hypothetical protein
MRTSKKMYSTRRYQKGIFLMAAATEEGTFPTLGKHRFHTAMPSERFSL